MFDPPRSNRRSRVLCWTGIAVAALAMLSPGQGQALVSPCGSPETLDRIAAVSAAGELQLNQLGTVRLADVRLAEGTLSDRPLAWLRSLAGREVRIWAGAPDRWQRRRAVVVLTEEAAPIDVAELLVAEGFATVDAGEEDALCRPALLEVENRARANRLGLWKAGEEPLKADDRATITERIGRFAVLEGRIVSVGERAARTYLNFGRVGAGALTVTLPKRTWSILRARGMSAEALRGRRVRVRGTLEMWSGPTLEVVAPDLLEILDAQAVRPR
jgi:hypothetical protein